MIDPTAEELITLAAACKLLPKRRRGKRPDVSCLYRWASGGLKGIVLETIQVGGTKCTSREALARFLRRLTQHVGHEPSISDSRRAVADAHLKAEGF